jgi:nucleoside-diphosphate-sugar epimerase
VIAVARFSDRGLPAALECHGVEPIPCDLLDEAALARLPDAPNVVYMAGRKFGTTGDEPGTWAMNTLLPALVCRRFARSRIAAFSTGNVYGLTAPASGGSREGDIPAPVGEYAMSCLGRERLFAHFSRVNGTPVVLLRLNYACEMRYGVLVDLARRVLAGDRIDVTMGHVNVIWQGDANAMALASLARATSPAEVLNIAGEQLSVRAAVEELARLLEVRAIVTGREAPDALLSNGTRGRDLLGPPRVDARRLLTWTADWVRRGGASLDKPTHFESRGGRF